MYLKLELTREELSEFIMNISDIAKMYKTGMIDEEGISKKVEERFSKIDFRIGE